MKEVGMDDLVEPFLRDLNTFTTQVINWQSKSICYACVDSRTMAYLSFLITLAMPQDSYVLLANITYGKWLNVLEFFNFYRISTS
jgi:hypothetical protein